MALTNPSGTHEIRTPTSTPDGSGSSVRGHAAEVCRAQSERKRTCHSPRTPTIYDVAALAGVSIATVSFGVRATVGEGQRRNPPGGAGSSSTLGDVPMSSRRLGEVEMGILGLRRTTDVQFSADPDVGDRRRSSTSSTTPSSSTRCNAGVQLQSWREGYALLVRGSVDGSAAQQNESVMNDLATRVDGLAVFPRTVPMEVLERLAQRIPVVALSEAPEGPTSIGFVTVDNRSAMFELTEHLLKVHGSRNLAFVDRGQ